MPLAQLPLALKLSAAVVGALEVVVAASSIPDANLVLNVVMLAVLLFGAPRFFRAKAAEAQMLEKDHTIATHEQTIQALNERHGVVLERVLDLEAVVSKREEEHTKLIARYDEQAKYTAKEALHEVGIKLGKIEELLRAWLTRDAASNALDGLSD